MADIVTARVAYEFADVGAAEVFDAWTQVALLRDWMEKPLAGSTEPPDIRKIETDPRVGGRFEFADMREDGLARCLGTYLAVERPRLLEFTWFTSEEEERDEHSLVRIEIAGAGSGCRVALSHDMSAAYADYLEQTETAWRHMLSSIDETFGR